MNPEEYIEQRLDDQIDWYDAKSGRAQRRFKWMRGLEIGAAAAIPLLAVYEPIWTQANLLVAGLGAAIAVLAGLLGVLRYQEIWVEYRTVCETLKHEKFFYLTRTPPYDGENAFQVLVQRVEAVISTENSAWAQQTRENLAAPSDPSAEAGDTAGNANG